MTKRTQVYDYHKKNGHLVDYAGFDLPVWFEGIIPECKTVRANAGLFDVSHMGRITVEGPRAEAFLDGLTTNDVSKLTIGQGHYSLLCNQEGGIIDDLTVFRTGPKKYLVVYNAGNREKNWKWLEEHRENGAVMTDLSDDSAMFAVQGPKADSVLKTISGSNLEDIDKYSGKDVKVGPLSCFVTRSGYTGEDGFEIYVWNTSVSHPDNAVLIWDKILTAGKTIGLKPTGLGARDVLRLEAGMCLYGNDIDEQTTPVEARLNFAVRLDKRAGFVGREAISGQKEKGPSRVRTGFKIKDRGIPRQGQEIFSDTADVGKVTSGTLSPTLGFGIGMGYVPPVVSKQGQSFEVRIRDRLVSSSVVRLPFYQRRSHDSVVVMGEEIGLRDFRSKYGTAETAAMQN
ncbi:MAG TPA: glycine cleavage system aminomethyltransferase GcvT [Candidatus Bathyarchaeia archaeon]|nr:glycine cleavage system aminomethyltransferase GcvT [Candidatus Bathyarchaeia archaeon]